MNSENPYQSLFWDMIRAAQQANSSDIHIQPTLKGVSIRFRIHGDLGDWSFIEEVHRSAFLQEAKRLCQCSLAVSGKAQDSRLALPDLDLDIRVSLVPSLHGEKLVLRLLDQKRSFSLATSGLDVTAFTAIHSALNTKTGVALMTGPTGSGKTTLLYSALSSVDQYRLNIITIEDPVEYTFLTRTELVPTTSLLLLSLSQRVL